MAVIFGFSGRCGLSAALEGDRWLNRISMIVYSMDIHPQILSLRHRILNVVSALLGVSAED